MPQVPLPQVSDTAPHSPQVTAPLISPLQDLAGPQIQQQGQAMSQAGQALQAIQIGINEDHASATSKAALNEWSEFADERDQKYRSQLGRSASTIDGDAVEPGEAPDKAAEDMEREIARLELGMSSELAKSVFRQHAERGMVSYRGRLHAHEIKQIKVHERAEDVATAVRRSTAYSTNGNPADFQAAVDATNETADSDGLGPEARKARVLGVQTSMHSEFVSNLLADKDTKGADEELRKIPKDQIDAKERSALRRKIDGVMSAEKVNKLGIDIVSYSGYRTKKDQLTAAAAKLPDGQRNQLARTAVLGVAKKMGATAEQIKAMESGGWQALLTDPKVINQLPEELLTLEQEIIQARYPGKPPAGAGTLKRGLETAQKMYDAKEITATELRQLRSGIAESVRYEAAARDDEAASALGQVEQIIERNRETGGPGSVDSPAFRQAHPDLVQQLQKLGVMDSARKVTAGSNLRVSDPAYIDDAIRKNTAGTLGQLTGQQLYASYYTRLSRSDWNQVQSWHRAQSPGKGSINSTPGQDWRVPLRRWAASVRGWTGVDKQGVPVPPNGDAKEQGWYLDLLRDAGEFAEGSGKELSAEQVRSWAATREMEVVTFDAPWTVFGMTWGADQHEQVSRRAMEAEIRNLEIAGDQAGAVALQAKMDNDVVVKIGDKWVQTAGSGTVATKVGDDDPIPDPAAHLIRNEWRLKQLEHRPDYERIRAQFIAAGGGNHEGKRDDAALNRLFRGMTTRPIRPTAANPNPPRTQALTEAWPPIEYQVRQWGNVWKLYRPQRQIEKFTQPRDFGDPSGTPIYLGGDG